MAGKAKATISASPTTVQWGGTVSVTATLEGAITGSPWIHAEALQERQGRAGPYNEVVYGQYVKGLTGSVTFGPTTAADESEPGIGRVEIGYWTNKGTFRALAVVPISVVP